MQIQRCVSLCMALLSLAAGASLSAVEPASEKPTWGEEPVVGISSTRGEMVLNGLWRFQPGVAGGREPADDGWGLIRVPGSWRTGYTPIAIPGVAVPGSGASWDPWRNDSLSVGWYERPLRVPSQWNGRAILLDMERVSTDAWVYLDGREAGRVGWPGGEVDITRLATPDREHQLRIFVAAIPGEGQVGTFMGPGAGQVSFGESNLQSKGIVGDVILRSRPRGAYISDVFVQTSTRRKQIALSVELTGIEHAGPVRLTARTERNGKVEKTFVRTVAVQAARVQILTVSWPWPNPALWDLDQPNLYTVKLNAEGAGLKDAYAQLFGFREFWVEGRKLFLNGVEIRFRPQVFPDTWNSVSGTRELVEGSIKGLRWAGHNIAELWPGEMMRRGQHEFREVIYDAADRLGFPLMGSAGCMNGFLRWGDPRWVNRAEWERLTRYEMRRARNHPSILIWTSSGNIFGHSHDQHPQALGRDNWYSDAGLRHGAAIESGLAFVRSLDPTRPAFIHQGILGYLYAVNTYLDLTPLQEREEWLSAWAEQGRKPYLAVEFGTPLNGTFLRGRADYFQACTTEPWATEFAATYFGPEAYHLETPAYRAAIRDHFQKEQIYGNWQGAPQLNFAPTTQAVENLFVRNTWRSWRAQGITAGMVPWDRAEGWETVGNEEVDAPPFQPGRRGTYAPRLAKEYLYYLRPEGGFKLHASARR